MDSSVLFFARSCPDTQPFIARLDELGVKYESVEIQSSLDNLKRFLTLRDSRIEFDTVKQKGAIGVPALLLTDGHLVLDIEMLNEIFTK